jgi:AraC-like DNA-binding protein
LNPDTSIKELSFSTGFSVKTIEINFNKRVGLSPKKFTRIMKFQKAHRTISKEGLTNLVKVALSSGYFDQPHFNREYKKLTGYNPNNETMSILYNTQKKK